MASGHSKRFNKADPSFLLEHRYRVVGLEGDVCSQCGSPFHPATGSDDGKYKHCGACVRSLVDGMKSMTAKRMTGGVDFYLHAQPPPDRDDS
jgi:hypothetical protein